MEMLFLPVYGKNKMPDCIGCFIVGVSSQAEVNKSKIKQGLAAKIK
jgi:hypothetical protein